MAKKPIQRVMGEVDKSGGMRLGGVAHLMRKGKRPSVRCPSRATTLQITWYRPEGSGGRLTSSKVGSLELTRPSPLSTVRLLSSSTRMLLKIGSIPPSNQIRTDGGGASTEWPTRGQAGSRKWG